MKWEIQKNINFTLKNTMKKLIIYLSKFNKNKPIKINFLIFFFLFPLFFSCNPQPNALAVREISGSESTSFSGLGIESHNIEQITLQMVSNLLESDFYKQSKKPPVIILESSIKQGRD